MSKLGVQFIQLRHGLHEHYSRIALLHLAADYRIIPSKRSNHYERSERSYWWLGRVSQNFAKRRKVCTIAKPVLNAASNLRRGG